MNKQDCTAAQRLELVARERQYDNLRNVIKQHFERYSGEGRLCDEDILAVLNTKAQSLAETNDIAPTHQYADMLYSLALLNYESCHYDEAALFVDNALRIREDSGTAKRADLLLDFELLVLSYNNKGKFAQAETAAHSWLRIAEDEYGTLDSYIGKVAFCLAQIYRKQSRYVEAEQWFLRALSVYAQSDTLESVDGSVTRSAYADFLRHTGREDEAKQIEVSD